MDKVKAIRQEIIEKTIEYYNAKFVQSEFIPGKSRVNYAAVSYTHLTLPTNREV